MSGIREFKTGELLMGAGTLVAVLAPAMPVAFAPFVAVAGLLLFVEGLDRVKGRKDELIAGSIAMGIAGLGAFVSLWLWAQYLESALGGFGFWQFGHLLSGIINYVALVVLTETLLGGAVLALIALDP